MVQQRHTSLVIRFDKNMTTQQKLEAHERECAVRYSAVQDALADLKSRIVRLEIINMISSATVIAAIVVLFMR